MLPEDLQELLVKTAGAAAVAAEPGRVFRDAREKYGFTQEWLAPRLGIRRETLSRIESGHHTPGLEAVASFARLMTLATGVREHVARLEADGRRPDPFSFRRIGVALGLSPDVVDDVIDQAMRSYEAKRASVLEPLRAAPRGLKASTTQISQGTGRT